MEVNIKEIGYPKHTKSGSKEKKNEIRKDPESILKERQILITEKFDRSSIKQESERKHKGRRLTVAIEGDVDHGCCSLSLSLFT